MECKSMDNPDRTKIKDKNLMKTTNVYDILKEKNKRTGRKTKHKEELDKISRRDITIITTGFNLWKENTPTSTPNRVEQIKG